MALIERIASVQMRINRACKSCGRDPGSVTLVAVTKTVGLERVREAMTLGLRVFGENRLQDAQPKIESLPDAEWHFIGRLQSNKAKKAASLFDVIQTVENEAQVQEIAKSGSKVDVLVQLNLTHEPQKAGISPEALDNTVKMIGQCQCARFRGLMTMGRLASDPEVNRPVFRRLAELGKEVGAEWLSMGMSDDLEVAIQEGSTHVRVGTAIFGERE